MNTLEQLRSVEPSETALWRRARLDWEDGVSVAEVCARYGLARSTAYQKVQAWRAEGAKGGGTVDEALDADWEPPGAADLARLAWRRLAQAVQRGRVYEAGAWRRLALELDALAAKEVWVARLKTDDPKVLAAELLSPKIPGGTPPSSPALSMATTAVQSAACDGKLASLDTPLPQDPVTAAKGGAGALYTPAEVNEWRTWALVSEHIEAKQRAAAAEHRPLDEDDDAAEWVDLPGFPAGPPGDEAASPGNAQAFHASSYANGSPGSFGAGEPP